MVNNFEKNRIQKVEDERTDKFIKMPSDEETVLSLIAKLKEYKARIEESASRIEDLSSKYKILVLESVLKKGIAGYNELLKNIPNENIKIFNDAFNVIENYVYNQGKNLVGGTGLSKVK